MSKTPSPGKCQTVDSGEPTSSALIPATENEAHSRPTWRRQIARCWYVLRYYRLSQLAMRGVARSRLRYVKWTGGRRYVRPPKVLPGVRTKRGLETILEWRLAQRADQDSSATARQIAEGSYRFLNQERKLPDPVDWRLEDFGHVDHLWRFHLHYHEFLLDLAAEGLRSEDPFWLDRAWQLVLGWIEANEPSDPRVYTDAWHPYCISRRLPVWILLWSAAAPGPALRDQVLHSICSQATFLEDHLEWDLRGNHLLENARALILVGAALDGPDAERWLRKGVRIFRKQLAEQVLPHAEHFERSPMYHARALEAVLDVRDAVESLLPELSQLCGDRAGAMAGFLREILHPDGQIPLLGDTCFGEAASPDPLIARSEGAHPTGKPGPSMPSTALRQPARARRVGDYWVYRDGQDFMIFDAGPVGADHLPAHAHADLLGIEASVGGRRLMIDAGVFGYEDDAMRAYCRSTAAHNVLQVDDADQCDMWSRFRMGYRGWPRGFESGEADDFLWARAEHDAYRRLGVPEVGRWIACRGGGPWLCVDWARGKGTHQSTSRLHLHPEVGVRQTSEDEVRLTVGSVALRLRGLSPGPISVVSGWYCPEFGRRLASPVIQWQSTKTLPAISGWCMVWEGMEGAASFDQADSGETVLLWKERGSQVQLEPLAGSALPPAG